MSSSKIKIALDFDRTYTKDPEMWDKFIELATQREHEVVCVTMRHKEEAISIPCPIIYTGRKAKKSHYDADIWIDDSPQWIFNDSF